MRGSAARVLAQVPALTPACSPLRHALTKMKLHHSRMLQDLSRKQEALSLEQRSLSTRRSLSSAPSSSGRRSSAHTFTLGVSRC